MPPGPHSRARPPRYNPERLKNKQQYLRCKRWRCPRCRAARPQREEQGDLFFFSRSARHVLTNVVLPVSQIGSSWAAARTRGAEWSRSTTPPVFVSPSRRRVTRMQGHIRYDSSKGNGRYFAKKLRVSAKVMMSKRFSLSQQSLSQQGLTIDLVMIVLVFGSSLLVVLSTKFDR